jgi:hypothetical protein
MEEKIMKKRRRKVVGRCVGELKDVYRIVRENITLFLGLILVSSGFLGFKSGKYCEGNPADYYACVNPTTYYNYPTGTIAFFVVGTLLIALWRLRKDKK